jgi:hypothetical protein
LRSLGGGPILDVFGVSWGRPKQVFDDLRDASLQRPLLVFTIDSLIVGWVQVFENKKFKELPAWVQSFYFQEIFKLTQVLGFRKSQSNDYEMRVKVRVCDY